MQALALKAYGEVRQRTAGEKEIEYALFHQITDALEQVANSEKARATERAEALHRNVKLWTTLAVDLMSPDNALSEDLKRSLIYLAEFVRQTSMKVMSGKADIADLISVNKTIMAGLAPQQNMQVVGEGA